jgi:predicted amidophosphoribosyltransferase
MTRKAGAPSSRNHADRLDLVPGFARWLSRTGRRLLEDCDLVTPVPLYAWRLWRRRYNQSAELARRLAQDWMLGIRALRADPQPLHRQPGDHGHPKGQAPKVLHAFKVPDPAKVAGKRVVLLDDVLTTGATVEACARALKRAGAAGVHVLVLARVVKASDVLI